MVGGSPNTLSASWMTPDPANGIITGFTISCNTPGVMLPPLLVVIDESSVSTTLMDLTAFTEYVCVISANTSAGEGPPSNSDTAMTDEDGKLHMNTLMCDHKYIMEFLEKEGGLAPFVL